MKRLTRCIDIGPGLERVREAVKRDRKEYPLTRFYAITQGKSPVR